MALKAILASLDEVAEPFRSEYREEGGKFVLDIEGEHPRFIDRKTHDGFRENNRKLHTDLEALRKRFENVDPDDYKKVKATLAEIADGKGETFQQALGRHIAEAKSKFQADYAQKAKEAEELAERAKRYQALYASTRFETEFTKVADQSKVRPTARQDFLARASRVFEYDLEADKVVPRLRDGIPVEDRPPADWAQGLYREADHLFAESQGGGAGGSGVRRGTPGVMRLTKAQMNRPNEAQRQAIAAGKAELVEG